MRFNYGLSCFTLFTALTGCGLLGSKNQPVDVQNVGATGCLDNTKDLVSRYTAGQIGADEWKGAFDCINKSVDFFTDFVHGSSRDAYTTSDMFTLVKGYLITNHQVNKDLLKSAFALKASLFGGDSGTFTKDEIALLKTSLTRLRDITTDLLPYLAIKNQANPSQEDLLDMITAFKKAGDQLADLVNTLPTGLLSDKAVETLITELNVSLGLNNESDLSQTLFAIKWVVFNTRRDAIEATDWPLVFKTAMGFAGIYTAYQASVGTDITDPKHDVASRLTNDYEFREFMWELAQQAKPYLSDILTRHNGVTPFPVIESMIDRLPAGIMDSIPKQTLKQTLKPLVRRFLISSSQIGIDAPSIETIYTLVGETVKDLGMLDRIYEKTGMDHYDVKSSLFSQALDRYEGSLSAPADKARFADIKVKMLSYKPLFYKDTHSIRIELGVGYSKFQQMIVLIVDRAARHVQKTYGSVSGALVTSDLEAFFKDFTDILFAVKIVDPTVPNFAAARLRDMDLFSIQSNGDGQASIPEIVNYAMILISAGDLTGRMQTEITPKCDRNLGFDIMGWAWIPADCFRHEFHQNLSHWIEQFPRLKRYWATLTPAQQEKATTWLEHGSRRNGYNQDDFGKFDFSAMATILHYTENLFTRFDFDQDEVLSKSEIGDAYPVFKQLLAKKANLGSNSDYLLKGIFTYIVKYQEMPETSGIGPIAKLAWWLGIYTLPTTKLSTDRMGVFNIVCQLAAPESQSQADLTKTICK